MAPRPFSLRRAAAVLACTILAGAMSVPSAGAHVTTPNHLWTKHLRSKARALVTWTNLKGIPAGFADGTDNVGDVWSGLTGVPAGFADGTDNDTTYSAGSGITLTGSTFSLTSPAWHLAGNAGTTAGTDFVGTTDDEPLELHVDGQRALRLEPSFLKDGVTSFGANVIGGHFENSVDDGAHGATIAGGGQNDSGTDLLNHVTDDFGTVGGGLQNIAGDGNLGTLTEAATVAGGYLNTASGYYSAIGGGSQNTASGESATISGGSGNIAIGLNATVSGGSNNDAGGLNATVGGGTLNDASGNYATIGGGIAAIASLHGQEAHGAGSFALDGDAQSSEFVARLETTGATPSELFLDGSGARILVAEGQTISFRAIIAARTIDGFSAGYEITGLIERVGATTALVGIPTVTILGEDIPALDAAATADNTNDALVFTVTGEVAMTVRWVASIETSEVTFPAP